MTRRKRLPNPNSPEEVRRAFAMVNEDVDLAIGDLAAFITLVAATYVPYSGAISDVSLGAYDLSATDLTATGVAHIDTITSTTTLSITNNVDMGGTYTVTNLTAPVNGSDAVTLDYLVEAITEVAYVPTSLTQVAGDEIAGTVAGVQVLSDGVVYHVGEVSGSPGYDVRFNFTSVGEFNRIWIHLHYFGLGSAHVVNIDLWNYNTSAFDTITTTSQSGDFRFIDFPVDDTNYRDGSGNAIMRFYHVSAGTTSHEVDFDYVALVKAGLGAASDHGALTGLADDDHLQYHTDTRAAAWLSAGHETTYNHANYDTAFSWGNHDGLYDLAGAAAGVIAAHELAYDHSSYDTAYSWGDHAGLYDLIGAASTAVGTHEFTYNHANYDTAYGWGDHAGLYDPAGTAATAVGTHESTWDHNAFSTGIETLTNGSASSMPICTAVYMSASATFLKAKADSAATSRVIGLLTDGVAGGGTVGVQTSGVMTASTLQWDGATGGTGGLVFDTIYYLSAGTAGLLTATAPSTVGQSVVPVGIALSTTKMKILDRPIVLL